MDSFEDMVRRGSPPKVCKTLGFSERMRLPAPAAKIAISIGLFMAREFTLNSLRFRATA